MTRVTGGDLRRDDVPRARCPSGARGDAPPGGTPLAAAWPRAGSSECVVASSGRPSFRESPRPRRGYAGPARARRGSPRLALAALLSAGAPADSRAASARRGLPRRARAGPAYPRRGLGLSRKDGRPELATTHSLLPARGHAAASGVPPGGASPRAPLGHRARGTSSRRRSPPVTRVIAAAGPSRCAAPAAAQSGNAPSTGAGQIRMRREERASVPFRLRAVPGEPWPEDTCRGDRPGQRPDNRM